MLRLSPSGSACEQTLPSWRERDSLPEASPWPLDWQRHYRVLADLVEADGVLPHIAPGIVFEGDSIGRWPWRQQEPGI